MLVLAFYDPFNPNIISISGLPSYDYDSTVSHIVKHGRLSIYSQFAKKSIIVKSCNLLIVDVTGLIRVPIPNSINTLASVIASYHRNGTIHSFDPHNHPELYL